jgi:hypothetical protein
MRSIVALSVTAIALLASGRAGSGGRAALARPRKERKMLGKESIRNWAPVLAAASALVLAPGAAAASDTTPDAQLLKAYQPVLVFHPDESFRPTKVQSFVADSQLEQFTGTNPQQLPLDAFWTVVDSDPEPGELGELSPAGFYRLNQAGCEADAPLAGLACYAQAWGEESGGDAVYGRVVRTQTRTVLQYWLFYYDNPLLLPPTPFGVFWQSHEGDWEVVNIILDADGEPLEAAYSQHCSGQRRAWADVEKRDGTHPVAYVGLGSHANFFAPGAGPLGLVPFNPICIPPFVPPLPFLQIADQVLAGPTGRQTIHSIEGMAWSEFPGRWGESEYFFTPIPLGSFPAGALAVGLAPASPPFQANWNVQTILGWPNS